MKQQSKTPGTANRLLSSIPDNPKLDTISQLSHTPSGSLSSDISSCDTDVNRKSLRPTCEAFNGNTNPLQLDSPYSLNTNVSYDCHEENGNFVPEVPSLSTWFPAYSPQPLSTTTHTLQHGKADLNQDSTTYLQYPLTYSTSQVDALQVNGLPPQPQISLRTECDEWAKEFSGLMPLCSTDQAMGSPLSSRQDFLGKASIKGTGRESLVDQTKLPMRSVQQYCRFANKSTESAWHTLIMPLTQKCEALYHAAKALTCFQESHEQNSLKEEGLVHERYAIQKLACEIDGFTNISAVATSLLLASLEPWEEGIAPANKYLKGAKLLINEALRGHFRTASVGIEYTRLKVLYNTWLCLDVIFRLTCLNDRELGDFTEASTMIPSNSVYDNNLDPLGGCIPSLFPIIGQGAELIHWIRSGAVTSAQMVPQALKIWVMLEKWSPSAATMIAKKRDPYSLEILRIADAYRFTMFLFISQAVPELASPPATFLAGRVLEHIAAVHVNPKTAMLQIFPLLAASGEIADVEGRNWVIVRWRSIARVRPDLSIAVGRCTAIIEEVWRRRDGFEAQRCHTLAAMSSGFDQHCVGLPPTPVFTPSPTFELSSQQIMSTHQQPLPTSVISSNNWYCGNSSNDDSLSTAANATTIGTATASTAATPITPATPATPASPITPGSAYTFPGPQYSQLYGRYQNVHARPLYNGRDGNRQDQSLCNHQYNQFHHHHHQQNQPHLRYCNQHQHQHQHQHQRSLLDQAYTVCGQLHWIQIMKEWGWDGFCILPWE